MSTDEDYDYASLAAVLNIPQSWIEKHKAQLPRIEYGRHVRFSREHAAEIRALFEVRPAPASTLIDAPSVPATLLDLKPGRAPRGRRRSA
ncbi:hypothetical protein C7C46_08800 [Streptomyces tateyamensis]|uniref:DNA-binding protein n=1 Tax=Streptomyces tateyamensis TaxID=565073 RepID=A0A2V4NEV9_9ACTN|nr:hypothetical protein [Streptomyces tateyamensis]PYC83425.1 hypothetical protein C7C46_08800 [Streptomyces tateyamensis]